MDAIIEALDYYLNNPELIQQHGKRSRQMAEKMSWKSVVERYVKEVYTAGSSTLLSPT